MVRSVALLVVIFWVFSLCCFGQQNGNKRFIIVIDPGHGGSDYGAIGINAIREKDMVIKIAEEMVSVNKSVLGETFEIYLTRNTDTLISLGGRAKLARKLDTDLFISLHCNHSGDPNAKGVEVYVPMKGEHVQESILLAYRLQKGMRQNIGLKSRGVKFVNFQVLRETVDYCPSVLIELGFLSNRDEAQHLTEDENIIALALSLLRGLKIKK